MKSVSARNCRSGFTPRFIARGLGYSRRKAAPTILAVLSLLPAAARGAGAALGFDRSALELTWDDNLSNSDRGSDRIDGLMTALVAEGSDRKSLANDNSLTITIRFKFETAWDYRKLALGTLGWTFSGDHKFGVGPFAPIVGATLGMDALGAGEKARTGLDGVADVHARFRLSNATVVELREEFTRRGAHNDVFDGSAHESFLVLIQDAGEHWQITGTARVRQGDVVSYALPPRPDLLAEAGAFTSLDTFGAARTAYSLNARSVTGALSAAYRMDSGLTFSAGYENRDTRRGTIKYGNNRWLFVVSKRI